MFCTCPEISPSAALDASHNDLSMLYSSGMVTPLRRNVSPRETPTHSTYSVQMTPLHIDDEDVTPPYQQPSILSSGGVENVIDRGHTASGATMISDDTDEFDLDYYHVPFMPFVPLFGIFINFYLVCQLSQRGLLLIIGYVVVGTLVYFCYSMHHSTLNKKVGNSQSIEELDHIYLTSGPLPAGTSFTPPRRNGVSVVYSSVITENATLHVHANNLTTPPRGQQPMSINSNGSRRKGYETLPAADIENT